MHVALMRGGTSKCVVLQEEDLPTAGAARDDLLLRLLGSPDPRQIDGLGGATSTTSKVVIVRKSRCAGVDIDYTFAQVAVAEARVDYLGNCGNCASTVGPFAIREGLIPSRVPTTTVRIFNTNTRKRIIAEIPTDEQGVCERGDTAIAGVPGTGAGQVLWFEDPVGTQDRGLLPTGDAQDVFLTRLGPVHASLVDAGNPVVFARAADLGLSGTETGRLASWPAGVAEALEEVRGYAAVALGLAPDPSAAAESSRNIPKVGVVSQSADYSDIYGRAVAARDQDITARILSMGTLHEAFALTGAIALGVAATVAGTTVADVISGAVPASVRIGHPSGVLSVRLRLDPQGKATAVGIERTARRLLVGDAFVL